MSLNLTIFLTIICFLFFYYLFRMVKKKKLIYKHALMWGLMDLCLLISIYTIPYLKTISVFLGIEKISNMIFLFGFIIIIILLISLTTTVSEQKNRITTLTQELSILEKKVKEIIKNETK